MPGVAILVYDIQYDAAALYLLYLEAVLPFGINMNTAGEGCPKLVHRFWGLILLLLLVLLLCVAVESVTAAGKRAHK